MSEKLSGRQITIGLTHRFILPLNCRLSRVLFVEVIFVETETIPVELLASVVLLAVVCFATRFPPVVDVVFVQTYAASTLFDVP